MQLMIVLLALAYQPATPVVVGKVDASLVRDCVAAQALDTAWACVRAEATDAGVPSGKLTTHFEINSSGTVSSSSISNSTFKNPQLEACVNDAIAKVRFLPPKDGGTAKVTYRLEFTPETTPIEGGIGDLGTRGGPYGGQDVVANPEPMIMGGLTKAQVKKALEAHDAEVHACADTHRPDGADALGAMVAIKFVVTASGTVGSSRIAQTSTGNESYDECLRALVMSFVFPKPKGTAVAVVTAPFKFFPTGSGETEGISDVGTGWGFAKNVKVDRPWVRGALSLEAVTRVITARQVQMQKCALRDGGVPNGKVTIRYIIDDGGKVTDSHVVQSSMDDRAFDQCVLKIMAASTFPATKSGVSLGDYPLFFGATSAPQ